MRKIEYILHKHLNGRSKITQQMVPNIDGTMGQNKNQKTSKAWYMHRELFSTRQTEIQHNPFKKVIPLSDTMLVSLQYNYFLVIVTKIKIIIESFKEIFRSFARVILVSFVMVIFGSFTMSILG